MKNRRAVLLALLFVGAALAAGPPLRLLAASPCGGGAPMACCAGAETGDGAAPLPCGCTLKPVTPSSAVVEAAAPAVTLAEAPASEVPAPEPLPAPAGAAVAGIARAGPLFLLHSSLLN